MPHRHTCSAGFGQWRACPKPKLPGSTRPGTFTLGRGKNQRVARRNTVRPRPAWPATDGDADTGPVLRNRVRLHTPRKNSLPRQPSCHHMVQDLRGIEAGRAGHRLLLDSKLKYHATSPNFFVFSRVRSLRSNLISGHLSPRSKGPFSEQSILHSLYEMPSDPNPSPSKRSIFGW